MQTEQGSSDDEAHGIQMARRLNTMCMVGANAIVALILAETWGDWDAFALAGGLQVLLLPFNAWVTLSLLPRLGIQRAETLRAIVNVGCTPIIMHWAHQPLAVWLWLPYVAMGFDHLGRRVALWLLLSLCAVMGMTAWIDGVPWVYPVGFTALALYCFQLSAVRLQVVQDKLRVCDEGRSALAAAHRELEGAHAQLKGEIQARTELEAMARDMARQAGRFEMAAGVLHNVGNALHGFTMLSDLLEHGARTSQATKLVQSLQELRALDGAQGGALAERAEGALLLTRLDKLAAKWRAETELVLSHIGDLQTNVQHVAAVVAKQQAYARPCSASELCLPQDVVRDAVVLSSASKSRGRLEIEEHYDCDEPVYLDRHRVLQIVMNLLRNAEDAALGHAPLPRIRVSMHCAGGQLRLTVSDNGVGISQEGLTKLFQFGYTTKQHGHGFGLHSSRLLASEIGGTLTCSSEGEGRGATFTLELPVARVSVAA
jgi:signal transduction histidine kinase